MDPNDLVEQDMAAQASPLVSVVTPFYNTAKYLRECIESVLAQSYVRWEHILVDNHSDDGSLEIATEYARRDGCVRLYRNADFVGQVANYNGALARISPDSTYCKIVQADDWIFPNCLAEMVCLAEENPGVGIVSSYRLKGTQVNEVGLPYPSRAVSGREICRRQLRDGLFVFGSPSTVMYRSEIVRCRRPFYEEGRLHEDTEACYEILREWDFGFVHQVLSFTRTENESISGSVAGFRPNLLDKLIVLKKFGRDFLNEDEFQDCWQLVEQRYLKFLARSTFFGRDKALMAHHRKGLESIQYRIPPFRFLGRKISVLADLLFNPKYTLGRIVGRIRR